MLLVKINGGQSSHSNKFLKRLSIREMHVTSLTCGQKSGIFTTFTMPFEKIIITITMHGLPTGLLKVSFFMQEKTPKGINILPFLPTRYAGADLLLKSFDDVNIMQEQLKPKKSLYK